MNPGEMARLLAACAMYDYRPVEKPDVAAWMNVIGDLDYDDAMEAVRLHYGQSTERMMPAHVRAGVKAVRDERRRLEPSDARALPSPFEEDLGRDMRAARGAATVRQVLAQITDHLADKTDRQVPAIEELRAITAGPDWEDAK
ncbi:MAG: hypothetical protein ABW022_08430 [Actinoplanes sp.]